MTYHIGLEESRYVAQLINTNRLERYVLPKKSYVSKFEKKFSGLMNSKFCLAVNSGTSALICSLNALGISHGDEVIIPAYTYVATALAVISVGAVPIISNINESLNIDPQDLESRITHLTKAIIPVHMNGIPCDMNSIMYIARKYNLLVIEDVAQACGGSFEGKRLGTIGDIGTFSFNHYKIISAGEGGAIVTNHEKLYLNSMAIHHGGILFEEKVKLNFNNCGHLGANYRLAEVLGAILIVQLKRLDGFLKGLRNEKSILIKYIKQIQNDKFYISPIPDEIGDCGRTLFIKFINKQVAKKFLNILLQNKIKAFSPFSKGHTAVNWRPIFDSVKVMKSKGHGTYVKEKLMFKPELWQSSNLILQSTIGIDMEYNRSKSEIRHFCDVICNLLGKL